MIHRFSLNLKRILHKAEDLWVLIIGNESKIFIHVIVQIGIIVHFSKIGVLVRGGVRKRWEKVSEFYRPNLIHHPSSASGRNGRYFSKNLRTCGLYGRCQPQKFTWTIWTHTLEKISWPQHQI